MKTIFFLSFIFLLSCGGNSGSKAKPSPANLDENDVGYYMMMIVADHAGPKAQLWLDDKQKPLWFVDVRDAIKFRRTPEEPDNISAIYVHDMSNNLNYRDVKDVWVELDKAVFVINSKKMGGMGMPETIPFSDAKSAHSFIEKNGGEFVNSAKDVPEEYLNTMGGMDQMNSMDMMNQNRP